MARNIDTNSKKVRSAISNGTSLFIGDVDGRSAIARRLKDHIEDLSAMMGGRPTAAHQLLIRRAATLSTLAESEEARMAMGEPIDTDRYARLSNTLGHILSKLGLARMANDGKAAKVIDGHTAALMGDQS